MILKFKSITSKNLQKIASFKILLMTITVDTYNRKRF